MDVTLELATVSADIPPLEIGLVERETGVPKDTLRIWERRYGFPTPIRSTTGRREYSGRDVVKLRLLKRLIDQGYRPKAIISKPIDTLAALIERPVKADGMVRRPSQVPLPLDLLSDARVEELSRWIETSYENLDARSFILDCVRPLCEQVGEAWASARLSIGCEHIITDKLHSILRQMIGAARYSSPRPQILLATPPGEKHGLGLLMVRALLSCDGVACLSLGTETPADEIAKTVDLVGAKIVGLSISGSFGKKAAVRFLEALRASLPADIALWAGGEGVSELSIRIAGVTLMRDLEAVSREFGRQPIDE